MSGENDPRSQKPKRSNSRMTELASDVKRIGSQSSSWTCLLKANLVVPKCKEASKTGQGDEKGSCLRNGCLVSSLTCCFHFDVEWLVLHARFRDKMLLIALTVMVVQIRARVHKSLPDFIVSASLSQRSPNPLFSRSLVAVGGYRTLKSVL